jgi:glycosyltransferase involved in cell wall biosynthesis
MSNRKISVAQIRGDGLSDRETKTWEYFPDDIVQTIFAARKNVYSQSTLPFPIITLQASSDNFLLKNYYKYFFGQYKRMFGLEKKLAGFDVVHAGELYNYYTYQAVLAKRVYKNLKVVATVWENSFGRFEYNYWPGFKSPPLYWRRQLRAIMETNAKGVDMFLPTTNDAAELLLDYGVPAQHIQVVTPGIIPVSPDVKPILPPQLQGKEVFLVVNRLVKEKGVYDILYGWRRYLSKTSNPTEKLLVIVGDGPERKNMLRIVDEWGFTEKIIFIRQLLYNEMLGLYQTAKCLVLGSIPKSDWQEQFGYVLGEAICASVPVIATFCGAIPEVVGTAGLLVSPAHPVDLSAALLKMEDPAVYARLKAACQTESQKFSVVGYANQVASIYRNLVNY